MEIQCAIDLLSNDIVESLSLMDTHDDFQSSNIAQPIIYPDVGADDEQDGADHGEPDDNDVNQFDEDIDTDLLIHYPDQPSTFDPDDSQEDQDAGIADVASQQHQQATVNRWEQPPASSVYPMQLRQREPVDESRDQVMESHGIMLFSGTELTSVEQDTLKLLL